MVLLVEIVSHIDLFFFEVVTFPIGLSLARIFESRNTWFRENFFTSSSQCYPNRSHIEIFFGKKPNPCSSLGGLRMTTRRHFFIASGVTRNKARTCQHILDPSAYAFDSARKLWETLGGRSQNLVIWTSQRMLFYPTKPFCLFFIYFIAKFDAASELELKKRSP